MAKTAIVPLNSLENSRLRVCEATIQQHVGKFVEVGNALSEIRDGQLYRETHKTFESYVQGRWDFQKRHAYRLIDAAAVVKTITVQSSVQNVSNLDTKPLSEAVIRPLTQLPPEQQSDAYQAALERAENQGKPVTAAIVEEVVAEIKSPRKCPNCGATERDEDGDCTACKEPAAAPPKRPAKKAKREPNPIAKRKAAAMKALEVLIRRLDDLGLFEKYKEGLASIRKNIGAAK